MTGLLSEREKERDTHTYTHNEMAFLFIMPFQLVSSHTCFGVRVIHTLSFTWDEICCKLVSLSITS
jgi:hypothetical protein